MAGVKGRSGGRNAKTVAQHKLTNTFRSDRHRDRRNPDPPKGSPARPRALTHEAAREWDRLIAHLETNGTLSTVDEAALRNYCELHAIAERLQRAVNTVKRISSTDHLHPAIAQLRQYRLAIRLYLVEFGLTPAARSRVQQIPLGSPPPVDAFAEFDEVPAGRRPQ